MLYGARRAKLLPRDAPSASDYVVVSMKLSKDVLVALSTVAWADGKVLPEEADALCRAAKACGLTGADLEAVERSTTDRVALSEVKALELGAEERTFVYHLPADHHPGMHRAFATGNGSWERENSLWDGLR